MLETRPWDGFARIARLERRSSRSNAPRNSRSNDTLWLTDAAKYITGELSKRGEISFLIDLIIHIHTLPLLLWQFGMETHVRVGMGPWYTLIIYSILFQP